MLTRLLKAGIIVFFFTLGVFVGCSSDSNNSSASTSQTASSKVIDADENNISIYYPEVGEVHSYNWDTRGRLVQCSTINVPETPSPPTINMSVRDVGIPSSDCPP